MRKMLGNLIGFSGLALMVSATLYGVVAATPKFFYLVSVLLASGDIGAIAWLAAFFGLVLFMTGAAICPIEPKSDE